jgi:hypothetical protein
VAFDLGPNIGVDRMRTAGIPVMDIFVAKGYTLNGLQRARQLFKRETPGRATWPCQQRLWQEQGTKRVRRAKGNMQDDINYCIFHFSYKQ